MKRAALLVFLLASPAAADEVILRSGARFEGRVVAAGETVKLQLDCGMMSFKRVDVARVVLKPSTLDEFDEKSKALAPDDAEGRRQLAAWAGGRGLDARARALHEEIVRIAPEDAASRAALGHVRHEGTWMTEAQAREARGEVRVDGQWIPREAAEIRAEVARRAAEIARLEGELDAIKVRLEKELAAAAETRRRLEREDCWSRTTLLVAPPAPHRWVVIPGGTVVTGESPAIPKPRKPPKPPKPPPPPKKM